MNTICKKVISILLCGAVMFSFSSAKTFAEELNQDYSSYSCDEGIISALQAIETDKDNFNLAGVNFEELTVSDPIKAYEYTSGGVSFIYNYIPLFYNNVLTAWAVESEDEDDVFYQISTAYVDEINAVIDNSVPFALIYDKSCCYLFDGSNIHKLGSFDEIESRLDLTENVLSASSVVLNSLNETHDLGYSHAIMPYGVTLPVDIYECPVKYVTQHVNNYKNLCWAASIACIVNYKNGNDFYTALKIAEKDMDGETNIDHKLSAGKEVRILSKYGLSYQFIFSVPSPSDISYNLEKKYPLYAFFSSSESNHAVVIYKCAINNQNINESLFYIMDPNYGSATAKYSNGAYKYTSTYSGNELTLTYTTRKY